MTDLLKNPIFRDETAAREWLEARVWANGRVCPHCGNAAQEKLTKLEGKAHRPGVYQCNEPQCRQQFTVTVNTVFERSKIPLTKWLAALFLMTASKKGISAHQVHRMLGISYKSTWFLMHRLREAMRVGGLLPSMGGDGGAVEVDEIYIGRLQDVKKKRAGAAHKNTVLSLLDRETGKVRSVHVATAAVNEAAPIIRANFSKEAHLMTDQAKQRFIGSWAQSSHATAPLITQTTNMFVTGTRLPTRIAPMASLLSRPPSCQPTPSKAVQRVQARYARHLSVLR